jgi:hypothetical protein
MNDSLTAARLREMLSYDAETGVFRWIAKASRNTVLGEVAGCFTPGERIRIRVDGASYKAHRLAWLHVMGAWPTGVIDHINGDFRDNRFANLRDVSEAVNHQNMRKPHADNSTGFLGVSRCSDGKYSAQICVGRKNRKIAKFDKPEAAHAAYLAAKRELHEGCTI